MTILAESDLTAVEREAVADVERPGVWIEDDSEPNNDFDGRPLIQVETDV
ncbi:MAG: hypothetical protein WKG01_11160 [Kofleriaceae bacterium]